ncbi:MAG TPA: hypothetical protein VKR58_10610 [Aquella sp.]|nr:hypothetical protein [Aquella sp.]
MNYTNDFGFDVVEYIKKLRNVGVSQEIAEVQGQELSHLIKTVANEVKFETKQELHADDLATKSESQKEIELVRGDIRESELRLQKEIELVRAEARESELHLQKEIQISKNELQKEIELVRAEAHESELRLQKEIANLRSELIKWILGIGITASIAMCGAMFTMLKMLVH